MPYIAALYDDATDWSMRQTAAQIATGSAFVPQDDPFHVPLLGGLHVYSDAEVEISIYDAPPLRGRFLKFFIAGSELRAAVELEDVGAYVNQLATALPKGKPWRTFYCTLGSVANIDKTKRDDFLKAVSEAFPIDAAAGFSTARLAYHNIIKTNVDDKPNDVLPPPQVARQPNKKTPVNGARTKSRLNPKAAPYVPTNSKSTERMVTIQKKAVNKPNKRSHKPKGGKTHHLKWELGYGRLDQYGTQIDTRTSAIDQLIKGGAA